MASNTVTTGSTDIHGAAMQNDPERLKRLLKKQADQVNKRDANGWMPLHVSWVPCTREWEIVLFVFVFADTESFDNS
jgi:hypothetical protein